MTNASKDRSPAIGPEENEPPQVESTNHESENKGTGKDRPGNNEEIRSLTGGDGSQPPDQKPPSTPDAEERKIVEDLERHKGALLALETRQRWAFVLALILSLISAPLLYLAISVLIERNMADYPRLAAMWIGGRIGEASYAGVSPPIAMIVIFIWLFAILLTGVGLIFVMPIKRAEDKIRELEDKLFVAQQNNPESLYNTLLIELFRLTAKTGQAFFDNLESTQKNEQLRQKANSLLDESRALLENQSTEIGQRNVRRLLSSAQSTLHSMQELVAREERERTEARWGRRLALGTMVVFISILFFAAVNDLSTSSAQGNPGDESNGAQLSPAMFIFQVPISILFWSAAGSLAAILYRFYRPEKQRTPLDSEMRWLIARPVIGVLMGAASYLVIVSGILVFANVENTSQAPVRLELLNLIAFVAGYSDQFYLALMDLVQNRTVNSSQSPTNQSTANQNNLPTQDESSASQSDDQAKQLPQEGMRHV
jgi:hypothetical protein